SPTRRSSDLASRITCLLTIILTFLHRTTRQSIQHSTRSRTKRTLSQHHTVRNVQPTSSRSPTKLSSSQHPIKEHLILSLLQAAITRTRKPFSFHSRI